MAFITLGTSSQLVIKVPTLGSTDWGDTMRTDTFLKIAEHNHAVGSGTGAAIGTSGISADAITGAKIRLDNDEYLRGRNAANGADISLIKVNTSDKMATGVDFANVAIINNAALQHRNAADSGYISTINVNASDKIALGADLANFAMIGNTYLTGRNNADSGYINLLKVGTDDKIAVGANILSANIETTATSLIDTLSAAVTLADNQSAITAGIVTLGTDESCAVHYRLVRNGVTQNGSRIGFNDADTIPSESFHGTNVGVTFTVDTGALFYATTSTGSTASMTYVVIKE